MTGIFDIVYKVQERNGDRIHCQVCTNTSNVLAHHSCLCLGHEYVRKSRGHLLAMFVEHAEETIVSSRLTLVIPLLSVTNYLMGVVKLKGQKRIDNLGKIASVNSHIRTAWEPLAP